MPLSKQQRETIQKQADNLYGGCFLCCDGYLVAAKLTRVTATKLGILVHVNGTINTKWLFEDTDEAKRFYPLHKKRVYTKKQVKVLGKKYEKEVRYYRKLYFSTARAFVNHIAKNNESIDILTYEEHEDLLSKKKGENNE